MADRKFFVGVDIGGTFTDVILAEQNTHRLYGSKKLTTPDDPSRGVLEALQEALNRAESQSRDVERVVHATTLATNLILEGKGAKVAYVATKGFGDTIMMGRERRVGPDRYDLLFERSEPPVPKHLVVEADERMDFRGQVVSPLDEGEAASALERLAREAPEAVAVCLIHAYANPAHERRIAELLRQQMPGVYIALSSDVWPEYREYERATTTVMSAYVGPLMSRYVERLAGQVKDLGIPAPLQIMQSNGGVMSADAVVSKPIQSIESGPAAGVIAACHLGQLFGHSDIISFDMGGTTAKAGLIRDGKPGISHDFHVGGGASFVGTRRVGTGWPIKIPVIDLAEVGAGGGSIAWVDTGGSLQVGPHSAGASPGPACYNFGGDQPTVTDANLVLGYLNPDYFLGGEMRIYPEASREAIEEKVARPLGMDLVTAASGIYEIANMNMASAVRIVTIERGIDPRRVAVMAFGGAGPAHIVKVAEQFDIPSVIVPITPGLASAIGLLVSDMTNDLVRTKVMGPDETDLSEINAIFQELESTGLAKMGSDGIPRDQITVERQVDARFLYQAHELSVPVGSGVLGQEHIEAARQGFRDLYNELYGILQERNPVELVNFRVRIMGSVPKVDLAPSEMTGGDPSRALKGMRPVYFKDSNGFVDAPVYDRLALQAGDVLAGPTVVEEPESTTIIPPSYQGAIDRYMSIVITST